MPFDLDVADRDYRSDLSDEQLEALERRQQTHHQAPKRCVGSDRGRLEQQLAARGPRRAPAD